jgi:hypothetical protein
MLIGVDHISVQAFPDAGGRPLKIIYYGLYFIWIIILLGGFMYLVLGASLTLELTHPRIKGLVGFEHWVADEADDYNTFKLHFIWLALRWDWV